MYVTLKVDFGHKGFSWDLIKTFTICPFVAIWHLKERFFWGTNISQKMKQPGDWHSSAVDIAPRAEHVANRRAWSVAYGATWRIQGDPWLGMLTHLGLTQNNGPQKNEYLELELLWIATGKYD